MKRVYQYFNIKDGKPGSPFVLCDEHRKTYNPPAMQDGSVVLNCLGDNATGNCEFCTDPK